MPGRRLAPLALLIGVLALLAGVGAARGDSATYEIAPTEFGLAFVNSAEKLSDGTRIQRGVDAGASLDRFPLYWHEIEVAPGQYNWSDHDAALSANEARGLGTLAILLGTPGFYFPGGVNPEDVFGRVAIGGGIEGQRQVAGAAGELQANGCPIVGIPPSRELYAPIFADGSDVPGPGKTINPTNHWATFVFRTVERYRPGGVAGRNVRYWEVWNEPDLCHFWGGSSQEFARLLKVAYLSIKHADPAATVIVGGFAHYGEKYQGGRHFLNEVVTELRADPMGASFGGFFDAFGSHHYSNVVDGYHFTRRIQVALAGTGWEHKPIWITESGVPVCGSYPGPDCPSPYRATAQDQASYIWQNIAYTRMAQRTVGGYAPIFHFMLHDDAGNGCRTSPPADAFGLVTNEPGFPCVPHSSQPREGYSAYRLATRYLSGVELLWTDIQDSKLRRAAFYDPVAKERRLLVWAIGGSDATASVPATSTSARRLDTSGNEVMLTPVNGAYTIALTRATNQSQPGSAAYTIGGPPYMIIERDTQPPSAVIQDLFPISPPSFQVSWDVVDLGSGVVTVELWVQRDGAPWSRWLAGQPATGSAFFTGQEDERIRFAVVATDRAGNQTQGFTPLAETVIGDGSAIVNVTGQVYHVNGSPAAHAPVVLPAAQGDFADANGRFAAQLPFTRGDVVVNGRLQIQDRLFLEDAALRLLVAPYDDAVSNGNFENGVTGWQVSGTSPVAAEQRPGSRDERLRLATSFVASPGVPGEGGSSGGNATVSQVIRVPGGTPYLALEAEVTSSEPLHPDDSCTMVGVYHDKFEIIVVAPDNTAYYLHCQQQASALDYHFIDLTQFAGQTVTLIFNLYQSSPNNPTSAWVDNVMIGNAPVLGPPIPTWLPLSSR